MIARVTLVTFSLSLGALTATAQLHLITGSPNPNAPSGYASALFRVTAEGGMEKVVDLVTDAQGTEWIAASQDLRKAVLAPKNPDLPIVVVDLDVAAVGKQCINPTDPDNGPISRWLLNLPDKGPVYAEFLASGNKTRIRGLTLDSSIPCDRSFSLINPSDVKYLMATGAAGVANSGGYDSMLVGIKKDGTLDRFFPHGIAYFDYQVPVAMFNDFTKPSATIIANNERLVLVGVVDDSQPSTYRQMIFRKSDRTWHRMPDFGEPADGFRAFGYLIVQVGATRKTATARESAGRPEWRTRGTASGPNMSGLFHESDRIYTGRLFLYDASTEKVHFISTNQGDSEILLVENGSVYYRVSDRLYSMTLTNRGLGPSRLMVTSESIRDAHWAFIKR